MILKKVSLKISLTCTELESAFKECEHEDDALKMGLVHFVESVLIGAKSNVAMNLDSFHLIKDTNWFNDCC